MGIVAAAVRIRGETWVPVFLRIDRHRLRFFHVSMLSQIQSNNKERRSECYGIHPVFPSLVPLHRSLGPLGIRISTPPVTMR